jgi:ureidoglycolate hydrolase
MMMTIGCDGVVSDIDATQTTTTIKLLLVPMMEEHWCGIQMFVPLTAYSRLLCES